MARRSYSYEIDRDTFSSDAYRVDDYPGIAFHVLGWETEPDEDTEWSGHEVRTGRVVCVMVGDDRRWYFTPEEIHPIGEDEYCPDCGQMGCHANRCEGC